jgi:ATP-dependent RNA helicase DeaD
MVWFRIDIGRERNADPRWLLPLICRAGDVTKSEIGAIRIFDRDSRFEVAADFADKFEHVVRSMKPNEGRISRADASSPDKPEFTANPANGTPRRKNGESKPASSSDSKTDSRTKKPWGNRGNAKASAHPHRNSGGPRPQSKTQNSHSGPPNSRGAHKPVSKHAYKKKYRAAQQTEA